MNPHLIWIDLEMTGLNPENDVILEIATLITDSQLNILGRGPVLAIEQPKALLDGMDEWNTQHHTESGLVDRVLNHGTPLRNAEMSTLAFVKTWTRSGQSPLCGNSIGQDRRFLRKYMPDLHSHFHYRSVDVSSVKELSRRWYPDLPAFHKKNAHQALDDIEESIAELRYYRQHIFCDPAHVGPNEDA